MIMDFSVKIMNISIKIMDFSVIIPEKVYKNFNNFFLKNLREMEYEKYTSIMREFQEVLLQYIDNEEDTEEIYQNLIKLFQEQKISENPPELLLIIQQIVHIANYHHRSHNFFDKLQQILLYFKEEINHIQFRNYLTFSKATIHF